MWKTPNRVIEDGEIAALARQTPAFILSDLLIPDDLASRYNIQFACSFEGFDESLLIGVVNRQQIIMDVLTPVRESENSYFELSHVLSPSVMRSA
jgi:hypothetical protein